MIWFQQCDATRHTKTTNDSLNLKIHKIMRKCFSYDNKGIKAHLEQEGVMNCARVFQALGMAHPPALIPYHTELYTMERKVMESNGIAGNMECDTRLSGNSSYNQPFSFLLLLFFILQFAIPFLFSFSLSGE